MDELNNCFCAVHCSVLRCFGGGTIYDVPFHVQKKRKNVSEKRLTMYYSTIKSVVISRVSNKYTAERFYIYALKLFPKNWAFRVPPTF